MFTPEFLFNDAKIPFFVIQDGFSTKNYTPYVFQPFLTKKKIFMSLIFHDLMFEI